MSLSRPGRSGTALLAGSGATVRTIRIAASTASASGGEWHPGFERVHGRATMALVAALLLWGVLSPISLAGAEGGLLLVGGALIGIPHGSSDFLVAHRLLKPRFRVWWLPAFLAAYLFVTFTVLLGWRSTPLATFAAFLILAGLHFGADDDASPLRTGLVSNLTRAATPIVPIFLCHPTEVAGIVGLMIERPATVVASVLDQARFSGLAIYGTLLGCTLAGAFATASRDGSSVCSREAAELVLLALAAVVLPPLLAFAVYFCLLHAVRHLASLGRHAFPRRGAAALGLTAAIVLPSALVCGVALGCTWDRVWGALSTERALAAALQVTASLTVPHMMLEWWAKRTML